MPHEQVALAKAIREVETDGAELVIVFGASAIADRRDVIPAAIEAVGGSIEHFGMPVDPGNLMLIGIGAWPPGARRAGLRALAEGKRFRLGADAAAGGFAGQREDITGMGVGGLLMEIVTRPQPREEPAWKRRQLRRGYPARRRTIHADGRDEQAARRNYRQAAGADRGGGGAEIAARSRWLWSPAIKARPSQAALQDLPLQFAHNPDFADGLSTSLRTGLVGFAGRYRRRGGAAGRHAAGGRDADRQADSAL